MTVLWNVAVNGSAALSSLVIGIILGDMRKKRLTELSPAFLFLRLGITTGLTADCLFLFLLMERVFSPWAGSRWMGGGLIFLALFCTALIFWRPLSLFPEDSGILTGADRSQQRKFTFCLCRLLFCYLFFAGWLLFLLSAVSEMDFPRALGFLIFSLITMPLLFSYGKMAVSAVYERLETIVDQQYRAELLNFMQVIRSQRHDFNFHMQAVAGMIENGRYEECREYVHTMVKNVEFLNDMLPLKNPAIAALVNTFFEMAANRGIQMEIQILDQLEHLPCTVYEINTVIGNLLQNAIDETEGKEAGDRWIQLLIMKRSRRCIIKVTNPCQKEPQEFEKIFQPGYSTKRSHEGIGLVTVKRITARYGGTVYVEHGTGIVSFIARIPMEIEV